MIHDAITEEIRRIRHELAARFDNDIDRIAEDLQRQQRESGREYITLPKRPPQPPKTKSSVLPAAGTATLPDSGQTNPAAG